MWIFVKRWDIDESVVEEISGGTTVEDKCEQTVVAEKLVFCFFADNFNVFDFQEIDDDEIFAESALENSSDTLIPPAAAEEEVASSVEESVKEKRSAKEEKSTRPRGVQGGGFYGDAFSKVPNTLPIQHLLPSGCRGFGRGLGFTPEGELLYRMKRFSNAYHHS